MALLSLGWHEKGGIERCVMHEAQGLARAGWQVTVFAAEIQAAAPKGVRLMRIPLMRGPWALRLWDFYRKGPRAVAEQGPFDVVHAHSVYGGSGHLIHAHSVHRVGLREEGRQPFASRARAWLSGWPPLARRLADRSFERARLCLAVSRRVAGDLRREYSLPAPRVKTLYMGVDAASFKPLASAARAKLREKLGLERGYWGLFCGWNWRRKGLDIVFQAMQRQAGARLIVLGEDAVEGKAFRRLAQAQGLQGRVRFVGRQDRVEAWFAAADVFVFPTRYEPFGMVVTEAMASGLPLLLPESAGVSEIVKAGRQAQVLEGAEDAAALSRAWAKLQARPGLGLSLGKANRASALELSWPAHVRGLLEIYRHRDKWPS